MTYRIYYNHQFVIRNDRVVTLQLRDMLEPRVRGMAKRDHYGPTGLDLHTSRRMLHKNKKCGPKPEEVAQTVRNHADRPLCLPRNIRDDETHRVFRRFLSGLYNLLRGYIGANDLLSVGQH